MAVLNFAHALALDSIANSTFRGHILLEKSSANPLPRVFPLVLAAPIRREWPSSLRVRQRTPGRMTRRPIRSVPDVRDALDLREPRGNGRSHRHPQHPLADRHDALPRRSDIARRSPAARSPPGSHRAPSYHRSRIRRSADPSGVGALDRQPSYFRLPASPRTRDPRSRKVPYHLELVQVAVRPAHDRL